MRVELVAEPQTLSERAAEILAHEIRACVESRGRCLVALSGGTEPWAAFRRLAALPLPWHSVHVFQVDERAAPAGHPERNWTHLQETLLAHVPIPCSQVHAMPVEDDSLEAAAARYAAELAAVAGDPAVLDLVHLGLGDDGHTASLVPGDPVLAIADAAVAVTAPYRGWRRMTLTYPAINRARSILWLIGGKGKARAYRRLVTGDETIPAGRVERENARVLADRQIAEEAETA